MRNVHYCILSLLCLVLPAAAEAPVPSAEFWEYMADFSDDKGNVLDPLEYDELLAMNKANDEKNIAGEIDQDTFDDGVDVAHVKNADVTLRKKSSEHASSSAINGAKL